MQPRYRVQQLSSIQIVFFYASALYFFLNDSVNMRIFINVYYLAQ